MPNQFAKCDSVAGRLSSRGEATLVHGEKIRAVGGPAARSDVVRKMLSTYGRGKGRWPEGLASVSVASLTQRIGNRRPRNTAELAERCDAVMEFRESHARHLRAEELMQLAQ